MAGLEGLPLLPIDPTKTGESEITEHLRDTLQEVRSSTPASCHLEHGEAQCFGLSRRTC